MVILNIYAKRHTFPLKKTFFPYICRKHNTLNMTKTKQKTKNTASDIVKHFHYDLAEEQIDPLFFKISNLSSTIEKYQDILLRGMHCHNYYTILWFYSGEGTHTIDTEEYKIEQDSIFFLSPKHTHSCYNWKGIDGIMLAFSDDFFSRLDNRLRTKIINIFFQPPGKVSRCRISLSAKKKIMPIIEKLQDAYSPQYVNDPFQTGYITSLFSIFLIDTLRMGKWDDAAIAEYSSQAYKIYLRFIKEVENNFTQYHAVKDYIKILNVSRTALNLCVKKYAQTTPLDIINKRLILEAKHILLYNNKSIREICRDLGVDDPSYFTKFFKQHTGMSPFEYRGMMQSEDEAIGLL